MASAVEVVRGFRRLRALVLGDAMLDTYLFGTAERLCREGPVPVVRKTGEQCAPGGAANTAANLRALGARVTLLGVTGNDMAGERLRALLRQQGVADDGLIAVPAPTLHKVRILADDQHVVRFDEGGAQALSSTSQQQLVARLEAALPGCDAVVLSDYGYGVVTPAVAARLRALVGEHRVPLVVDSKRLQRLRHLGATVITPNEEEARLLVERTHVPQPNEGEAADPADGGPRGDLEELGRRLLMLVETEHVAITLAERGVLLISRSGAVRHLPAHPVPRAHQVGAGDTFCAALALALAAGASMDEAARIGLDAAAIAVSQPFTAVASRRELLQRVSLRTLTATRLTEGTSAGRATERRARARLRAELAAAQATGETVVFTNGVFDILHAGHVELLRRAKALGDVLVVGVNSDRSVRRLKGPSRPINREDERLALVAALDSVDHVILFDEDTPADLIRVLRPDIHVKGGDYATLALPEDDAVREVGARKVILPLAGPFSTTAIIGRILGQTASGESGGGR